MKPAMVGQSLAHYKVLEKLGSGGMGDVYVAEDTKLGRKVALKVLPPDMATDERLSRFEREAKAVAALNHPNIVTVYSVEDVDGVHFITMELVLGKTLSELIPKKGFSLNRFFELAIPLADAVSAAHQHGVVHRDLKPDNLMQDQEQRLKILDFGLAKWHQASSPLESGMSEMPTQDATGEGRILGTLAYMSPEQAEGKSIDHRSDIFSMGIILHELATGQRPFQGETPASTLSAIIKDTPPSATAVNPRLPTLLGRVIRRCLAKDPERRYQSAKDLRNELEELKQDVDSGEALVGTTTPSSLPARWKPLWVAGAVVGLVAAAWVGGFLPGRDGESRVPPVPRLTNPVQVTFAVGVEDFPTWSPDGETIAFQYQSDIWVAQVGGQPVNRTAGHAGGKAFPSWSPDGRQIAFLSNTGQRNLSLVPALGGTPRTIVSWSQDELRVFPSPWRWSPDGAEIAFGGQDEDGPMIGVLSAATGERVRRLPARVRKANQILDLSWSPDGDFFAFADAMNRSAPVTGLSVLRASDGETIQVTDGRWTDWHPTWSADSRTLFFVSNRGGSNDLWQQALDPDRQPVGDPQPVTTAVGMRTAAFSPHGKKLVYSKGREVANVWRVPIFADRPATWSDATQITFDEALIEFIDISPDGERLAVSSDRAGNHDLWVLPAAGGEMQPLTTDPMPDWYPRWSPDGKQIAFYAYRSGNRDIWVMPVGGGRARQLTTDDALDAWPAWSPDGKTLAFMSSRGGSNDIWTVPSDGGRPLRLTDDPGSEWSPIWSFDGEHIVFLSGGLWRLPANGGETSPLTPVSNGAQILSQSGNEIFHYSTRNGSLNVWAIPAGGSQERQLTDFTGRHGNLRGNGLATDGEYLYFVWADDLGDIWVMDVVRDSGAS